MRASPLLLVAFLFALGFVLAGPGFAQQGHDVAGQVDIEDLPVEQRQRTRRLWSEVVCACPRENWSKTLANCPDGCADPQKQQVLAAVAAGLPDDAVLDQQVAQYGERARASPRDMWTYLLPFLVLLGCVGLTVVVLLRWKRAASPSGGARRTTDVSDEELSAVERELEELT